MEPSDEALIQACREGDAAAWETLVGRYQRLVYSISRRAGLDQELASEVFQGVFAALVESLHRIERPAQIGAWLATAARRETWRVGRRERAFRVAIATGDRDERTPPDPSDGDPLPDEMLLRLERQHLVRRAVEALDERCRRLLTLLFYREEPPPYAEIAAALGTTAGSIGPTRARCLEKLRQRLFDLGF
jgi:RNA polymerase sigma factor (sigma-70 family)